MPTQWDEHVEQQATLRVEYNVLSRRWSMLQSSRIGLLVLGIPILYTLTWKYYDLLLIIRQTVLINKIVMLAIPIVMLYVLHIVFMSEAFLFRVVRGIHLRGLRIERELNIDTGIFGVGDMEYMPQPGGLPVSFFNATVNDMIFAGHIFIAILILLGGVAVVGWIQ